MSGANTRAIVQSCYDKLQRLNATSGDAGLSDWQAELLRRAVEHLKQLLREWA